MSRRSPRQPMNPSGSPGADGRHLGWGLTALTSRVGRRGSRNTRLTASPDTELTELVISSTGYDLLTSRVMQPITRSARVGQVAVLTDPGPRPLDRVPAEDVQR